MSESRRALQDWRPDDALETVRVQAMQDLAAAAQLEAASPNVHLHKSPTGQGTAILVDAQPSSSSGTAWLAIRDSATPLLTPDSEAMYYDAWIDPKNGTDTYLGFLNGTVAPNAIAADPNQINNVSGEAITVTLADGTPRTGVPLHGLEIIGFPNGSTTSQGDTPKTYPIYKITVGTPRQKFHQESGWIVGSYVLWPGILNDSGDPVGDETVSEGTQDKLWVRMYFPGPCASGT